MKMRCWKFSTNTRQKVRIRRDGSRSYENCFNYYGCDCDDWFDEELEEKARAIPWEEVIAIPVGV